MNITNSSFFYNKLRIKGATLIKLLSFIGLLWITSFCLALGEASFEFIGFSQDGQYLAFEQYGIQDGSGFPRSEIFVVDVDDNAYVAAPFVMFLQDEESLSLEQVRTANLNNAQSTLDSVGIVPENTGQKMVSRLPTDLFADSQNVYFPKRPVLALYRYKVDDSDYSATNDYYQITLDTQPATSTNCEFNDGVNYPSPAILTLTLRDAETQAIQVLQEDSSLPESRGCVFEYVIREVYFYQRFTESETIEKVAVFLNSYQLGFEGPDAEWLVVTGAISDFDK